MNLLYKHPTRCITYKNTGIIESLLICGHTIYSTPVPLHAQGPYVKQLQYLICGRYRVQIVFASWLTKKEFLSFSNNSLIRELKHIFVLFV